MKGMGFKAPKTGSIKPTVKMGAAPKIHPAADFKTRVRLPDTSSIGADPAPIVPATGKI